MISELLIPKEPLFMDFNKPNYFKQYKTYVNIIEILCFINPKIWEIHQTFENLEPIWKRRAPTYDDDPSHNISRILDMYFISIKKHEMGVRKYVPNII